MNSSAHTIGRTIWAAFIVICAGTSLWIFASMAIPSFLQFQRQQAKVGQQDIVVQQMEMDRVAYTLCQKPWASGEDPHHDDCAQYEGIFPGSPGYSEAAWTQYRNEAFQWVCAMREQSAAPWCREYERLIPEWSTFDRSERTAWEEANWRYMCAPLARLRVMKHNPWNLKFRSRLNHLRWCDSYTLTLDGFADLDVKRTDFFYTRLADIDRKEASWF